MAIYRTGKATMDAKGVIRGEGTKWKSKLSLIRAGATIIFATNPVKFAVISEVVDDTTIQAISMGNDVVSTMSDYVILVHDSLTVDGLAQDVAETLRYYQGKENQFAHFIEVVQTLDHEKLQELINQIKEQNDKFEENFGKIQDQVRHIDAVAQEVETNKQLTAEAASTAREYRDEASDFSATAQQYSREAAQSVEDGKAQVQLAANQVRLAADQVKLASAEVDKSKTQADRAKEEADRAADLANQADVTNLLRKDKNLSDLTDVKVARRNVQVDRLVQDPNMTRIQSFDPRTELRIGQDDWFVYRDAQDSTSGYIPLGIRGGGTGGESVQEVKENFEIERFVQVSADETQMQSGDKSSHIFIQNDGNWGAYDNGEGDYIPLSVGAGGTGAKDAAGARANLQVDALVRDGAHTFLYSPNKAYRLVIRDDGLFTIQDGKGAGTVPWRIDTGGTGARDAAGARNNLEAFYFKRTALGASDNLNDISGFDKVGIYYNAANANATEANNYPTQFAGVLVVLSARGNGVEQTMQYYYPYIQPEMYYVRYYNKQGSAWSWSKWERYESADYLRGDTGLTATGVLGPANADDLRKNCFFAGAGSNSQNYKLPYSPGIAMRRVNTTAQLQIDGGNGTIWTRASVDGGAWTEWKAAAMLQSSPEFTGGHISASGSGKKATVGTGSSDIYLTNTKSNKYLQLKDDGSLQYDSKHVMHNNLNYTAGIYDVTLKTFRITANGNNLHLKATTNNNPQVFLAGFNAGDTRLYWMGCGTTDNAVTLRSDIGSNQIKLLSDGAINLETAAGAKNIYAYADNFIVRKGSRAFSYNNRGTASQDGQIYLWGNSSGRPDVMEFGFTSGYGFYVQRNTDNSRLLQVNGSVQCTSLVQGSDRDLKENVETIQNATESLRKMNGYTYTLKSDGMPYAGVIAQEVMEALPEAISGCVSYSSLPGPTLDGEPLQGEERYLGVDYSAVTGLLVQVCRESDDRITKLEAENSALKSEIAELKELISQLLNK